MSEPLIKSSAVRILGDFFDGIARFDPTTVAFKVMDPSAVITTYSYGTAANVVRLSLGKFACDVNVSSAGTWHYRIESTTAGLNGDQEGTFTVAASVFL